MGFNLNMGKRIGFIILVLIVFYSCTNRKKEQAIATDSLTVIDTSAIVSDTIPSAPVINYLMVKSKNYKTLVNEYDTAGANIILALNRIDKNRIRTLDSIVVPDTIINDFNLYSPFPQYIDLLEKVNKIIIVSQTVQAFAIYEFGNLIKWGPTSTGKKSTPTPNGLFATNWKSKKTISTDNDEWILKWCFNLENFSGVSLHEYELPGYPASHACARLLAEDAKWIYYWADQWILTADGESIIVYGTPVILYGDYDYKGTKPWRLLPTEPEKAIVNNEELETEIQKHILTILMRQEDREKILTVNIDSVSTK
ncbi:MAG: L,D-transpeptidase [Ignavibacteriaceae bacterium]